MERRREFGVVPSYSLQLRDKPLPADLQFRPSASVEGPMQLGWARLTPEEHHRRVSMGLCIYCAQSGHYISRCPRRLRELQSATSASALASETNTSSNSPPCICLPATIFCPSGSANLHVLIDSGSDENFIDGDFSSSKFPVVRIDSPQPAINGSPLETVTHQMVTLSFTISSNH